MRSIPKIKADIEKCVNRREEGRGINNTILEGLYWAELFEALTHDIPLNELEVLCEAWREGKAVVLPCKAGDTLYDIFEFIENRASPEISEYKAKTIEIGEDRQGMYFVIDCTIFRPDDFGKTVFLTLEAAEAALKEGEK